MAIGLANAKLAEGGEYQEHRVQGIAGTLDSITLTGQKLKAVIGDVIIDGNLTRTIEGASTLTLDVLDAERRLLRSSLLTERHRLELDRLGFVFAKVAQQGLKEPLELTYEPQTVVRLRGVKGPNKAFRDKVTRAEFAKRLVRKVPGAPIYFVCPQLHKHQPIKNAREAREARGKAERDRRRGIGDNVSLMVKESRATIAQKQLGDKALRIAETHSAPERVMVALIVALIVESEMGKDSRNILQGEGRLGGLSPEAQIVGFLTGKNWTETRGGAIGYFKRHPDARAYEIAQAVQISGAGQATDGRANYGPWVGQAEQWVEQYSGGVLTSLDTIRYAYEQGKNETVWACNARLAAEVNWRWFESAGGVYFAAEPDLLAAMQRFAISDSSPGIEDTSFDYDVGKPVNEIVVQARAKLWTAPPGTCGVVSRHGPADGRYIVASISAPLSSENSLCEITLKRPTKQLPEPAPKTRSARFGTPFQQGSANDAPLSITRMIAFIDAVEAHRYPYKWGGGHDPKFTPPYDCSGFLSAVLRAGGYLKAPMTSGQLAGTYQPGEGAWFTLYANASHVFGKIRTANGWRFFGTSHSNPGGGAGWVPDSDGTSGQPAIHGKAARHPKGL